MKVSGSRNTKVSYREQEMMDSIVLICALPAASTVLIKIVVLVGPKAEDGYITIWVCFISP